MASQLLPMGEKETQWLDSDVPLKPQSEFSRHSEGEIFKWKIL